MTQYKNRCIFHSPINTSFVSKSYCAFFIPGGLSPPEFSCAFFKDKKVPPWNRKSAPRTEKKRPPEGKKAPPWKVQSTHKFPAAHQKCYMGHSVSRQGIQQQDFKKTFHFSVLNWPTAWDRDPGHHRGLLGQRGVLREQRGRAMPCRCGRRHQTRPSHACWSWCSGWLFRGIFLNL